MRKILALLLALPLLGQSRTFTPTLRANSPTPLTIAQVDGNFTGVGNVANAASRTYFASSQAAMLSLFPTPQQGDLCWRTDAGDHYVFLGGDPTSIVNWATPGPGGVTSVFGRQGGVVATTGDYTVAQVTGAAPLAGPTFTGTVTGPLFYATGSGGMGFEIANATYFYSKDSGGTARRLGGVASNNDIYWGAQDSGWGGNLYFRAPLNMYFQTNTTVAPVTALTLDSSQNATFAGSVTATTQFTGPGTGLTGSATSLTSGTTNALKSATTTVNVSSATAPSTGQVLTATSSTAATWQTPTTGQAQVQTFNSSGTFTPAAGVNFVDVVVQGGGGGGGGGYALGGAGGGGGGAGATIRRRVAVTPGVGITVTVGAAGAGNVSNGNTGGDSSFGSLIIAKGGVGGTVGGSSAGGAGGASGGPDTTWASGTIPVAAAAGANSNAYVLAGAGAAAMESGGGGGGGANASSATNTVGGSCDGWNGGARTSASGNGGGGGASSFGIGGAGGAANSGGAAGANTGAGGGGGASTFAGGNGGAGVVIVYWIN